VEIASLSHERGVQGVRWESLAVAALLVGALLLRLPGVDTPSVEQRENQSSILARGYFLGDAAGGPEWQRRVLGKVDTVLKPYEPPALELAAAAFYRATGGERIWFPRLLSALAWIAGGLFLTLLARRVTATPGMLTALLLYLVWPYAAWHSRKFMPDALLVACLLAAALTIVRYWERPSRGRFVAAGATSAVATAVKPGVAFLFLVALFAAFALSRRRVRAEIVSGRLPLFAGLAASLAAVYVLVGRYATDFVHPAATSGRVTPDLALTAGFWEGWWNMVSFLVRFPQPQELLAVLAIALGVLGLVLVPRGTPRTILWGLAAGYLAFGLAFATYTATHPYYALPLIPVLALAIGVVVDRVLAVLSGVPLARSAVALAVLAVTAVAAQKVHATLTSPAPLETIADYRRIGELTNHTTRAIVADDNLSHPIMYWGWIVGQPWDLGNETLPSFIDPAEKDFLIVVGNHQLAHDGLRAFARGRPVVARTDRFTVFDLRTDLLESEG
jgi:hypothetical protein